MRPDRLGQHHTEYDKNRLKILKTQTVCGICGKPVDKSLRYPHPLSPTVDHIIPVNRGGHPSSLENLQLAHWMCNRQKSDKLLSAQGYLLYRAGGGTDVADPFPLSVDWVAYRNKPTR